MTLYSHYQYTNKSTFSYQHFQPSKIRPSTKTSKTTKSTTISTTCHRRPNVASGVAAPPRPRVALVACQPHPAPDPSPPRLPELPAVGVVAGGGVQLEEEVPEVGRRRPGVMVTRRPAALVSRRPRRAAPNAADGPTAAGWPAIASRRTSCSRC